MPTKAHQSIREYVEAIRPIVDRNDRFGAYIMRRMYGDSRIAANGLFQRVRDVRDAVIALGGTLGEARDWTYRAYLWWSQGTAIEQIFARYELDPRASRAMDQLLKLLQSLPDELIQVTPPAQPSYFRNNSPFGAAPNPFASKPAAPPPQPPSPPAASPTSAFGSKPGASATPSARPPFGQTPKPGSPFGQPAPTPPKPSLFASRHNASPPVLP